MRRVIGVLLLSIVCMSPAYAAQWTKLQDNKHARLMLDKQSMAESGKYQKAWVKIDYKTLQTNLQYAEKHYNNAKLLWYFNCEEQKSATAQVYQLLDEELVFSAAIDIKRARFLEPVPETEADIAMHYVCGKKAREVAAIERKERAAEAAKNKPPVIEQEKPKKVAPPPPPEKEPKPEAVVDKSKKEDKKTEEKGDDVEESDAHETDDKKAGDKKSKKKQVKRKRRNVPWKYAGSKGPEFWGDLSDAYATCSTGRNQSPINIDKTISTTPKPLKTFQRFPVVDVVNNGHTVQANFKPGNIMVVDGVLYQMKQVHFHAPSENQIMGKSYPLEAHFVHADPSGNLAVLAVMFDEGHETRKKTYYRFSGSLTTPPCSEGVVWIVMKTPMTASKKQIDAFKKVMKHDNNRPVQPLNGRMVIE